MRDRLLQMLAAACLIGVAFLAFAGEIKGALLRAIGPGMPAALFAEAAAGDGGVPASHIRDGRAVQSSRRSCAHGGRGFRTRDRVQYARRRIRARSLFGVWLLPGLGSTYALLAVAAGYLVLSSRRAWLTPAQWSAAAAVVAFAVWAPSLALIELPAGGRVLSYTEGAAATVSVIEDARGVATLHINNRQQEGSSATLLADARQGLLPILLHPAPHRALFLGVGNRRDGAVGRGRCVVAGGRGGVASGRHRRIADISPRRSVSRRIRGYAC